MACIPFSKKKKVIADVTIYLTELTSVPLVNAVLFTKLRVLNSRGTSQYSKRIPVVSNLVSWTSEHKFRCKFYINSLNNMIESKFLKISIRKESNGGKSYSKLGFVMINLACFISDANFVHQRKYILEGYSVKGRQDNSLLLLSIKVESQNMTISFTRPAEDVTKCIQCFSLAKDVNSSSARPIVPPTETTEPTRNTCPSGDNSSIEKADKASTPGTSLTSSPDRAVAIKQIDSIARVERTPGPIAQASLDDMNKKPRTDFSSASFDTSLERRREILYANGSNTSKTTTGKQQLLQQTRMDKNEVVNGVLQAFHQQGSGSTPSV